MLVLVAMTGPLLTWLSPGNVALASHWVGSAEPEKTTVRATRFELVDEKWAVRAVLGIGPYSPPSLPGSRTENVAGLVLLNEEGQERGRVALRGETPFIALQTASGTEMNVEGLGRRPGNDPGRPPQGLGLDPNFSLTLEHLDISAAGVTNRTGATSYWNNEVYQRTFDYLWGGRIDGRLLAGLNSHAGLDPDKVATTYLGNHDHSHVAWQAGARDNAGALRWYRVQPYAIALLTAPGVPMVQNGQEFAEDYWIMEDDGGSNRRVKPRPVRWGFKDDSIGRPLRDVFARLIAIRQAHPGLRSDSVYPAWEGWMTRFNSQGYGVDADRGLMIYHRWGTGVDGRLERFMVVLNFSPDARVVDVPFPENGGWEDLLNGTRVTVGDSWLRGAVIESNWGHVYYQ